METPPYPPCGPGGGSHVLLTLSGQVSAASSHSSVLSVNTLRVRLMKTGWNGPLRSELCVCRYCTQLDDQSGGSVLSVWTHCPPCLPQRLQGLNE